MVRTSVSGVHDPPRGQRVGGWGGDAIGLLQHAGCCSMEKEE